MKEIEVVAAIIHDDEGRIFATQRGYGDYKDGWEFPGGKMEPGESPEEALKREIWEELETKIVVERLVQTVEYDYPKFHLKMHCFWCHIESGSLILKEHEAARWLSPEQFYSVDWLPADLIVVKELHNDNCSQWESLPFMVAETPSRDLDVLFAELHYAKGAYFISLLKEITLHGEFRPIENEDNIYFTGGERSEDFQNLLNAARKAVEQGYKVYILPNPKGTRTPDYIFEKRGNFKAYDLKTISGKSSVSSRLFESIGQSNRVLLNMTVAYNARLLASDIKAYFETNPDAVEVLIYKGKKTISVGRYQISNPLFNKLFRRKYEK